MKDSSKLFVLSALTLCSLQALVILLSWIISALYPESGLHSLLSGVGLRWLLSTYASNMNSDTFVWLVELSIFLGAFIWSGLPGKIIAYNRCDYNERFALKIFFFEILIGIISCIILAVYPHSSLLSITGNLFPGPYIKAVAIILGMSLFIGSLSFLLLSGKVKSFRDIEKTFVYGVQCIAPLIVIYFLLNELYKMVLFVMAK